MQLFSRIVIGVFAKPRRRKTDQSEYEAMQAVIVTPNAHPALSPM